MYNPNIISDYVKERDEYSFEKKLKLYKLCKKTSGDLNLNIANTLNCDRELNRKKVITAWISLSCLMGAIDVEDSEIKEVLNEYR